MKIIYVSRTGNVEAFVNKLNHPDVFKVETGEETISEPFIVITYTDGYGDVPYELESFLPAHKELIKGVFVSGDISYDDAYCKAGDIIAEEYGVPCFHKFENDGTDEDVNKVLEVLKTF